MSDLTPNTIIYLPNGGKMPAWALLPTAEGLAWREAYNAETLTPVPPLEPRMHGDDPFDFTGTWVVFVAIYVGMILWRGASGN